MMDDTVIWDEAAEQARPAMQEDGGLTYSTRHELDYIRRLGTWRKCARPLTATEIIALLASYVLVERARLPNADVDRRLCLATARARGAALADGGIGEAHEPGMAQ